MNFHENPLINRVPDAVGNYRLTLTTVCHRADVVSIDTRNEDLYRSQNKQKSQLKVRV